MVHTFHYSKGHKFAKTNFPNLTAAKLHRKDNIDAQSFLKLTPGQNQRMNMKQKTIIPGVL